MKSLQVEVDTMPVLKWITKYTTGIQYGNLINERGCGELLAREREVELNHIFREENQMADHLARIGNQL